MIKIFNNLLVDQSLTANDQNLLIWLHFLLTYDHWVILHYSKSPLECRQLIKSTDLILQLLVQQATSLIY